MQFVSLKVVNGVEGDNIMISCHLVRFRVHDLLFCVRSNLCLLPPEI